MKHIAPLCDCSGPGSCVGTSPRFKCRSDNGIPYKQASAAEQGHVTCPSCLDGSHGRFSQPAQPPAGDVQTVERMCDAFYPVKEHWSGGALKQMERAFAVAREGYVSLADVERAIADSWHDPATQYCNGKSDTFISLIRNRLAKPAERVTDEQKVAAMLNDSRMDGNDLSRRLLAKKIVAALRDGREGK